MKLRNKIFTLLVSTQTVLMLLFVVFIFNKVHTHYIDTNIEHADKTNAYLENKIEEYLMFNNALEIDKILTEFEKAVNLSKSNVIQKIEVKNQYGEIVSEKLLKRVKTQRYGIIPTLVKTFVGRYYQTQTYNIIYEENLVGHLNITISNRGLINSAINLLRATFIVWFAMLLLISVIYYLSLIHLSKNINTLNDVVSGLEDGSLAVNDTNSEAKNDEISKLVSTIQKVSSKIVEDKKLNQKLNLQKSILLTNIINNLLTPLNGMMGAIELLKVKPKDQINPTEVNFIEKSAGLLLNQITNVLTYLDIKESESAIKASTCSMSELVGICYRESKVHNYNNIEFIFENNDTLMDVFIQTDIEKLKIALKNIIDNALGHTQTGYVRVNLSSTNLNTRYMKYEVYVEDTGSGINEGKLEKLKTSLETEDQEIKTDGKGLGLAISSLILKKLKGNLNIYSIEGHGTTVVASIVAEKIKVNRGL